MTYTFNVIAIFVLIPTIWIFIVKRVVKTKKSIPELVKTKFENDGFRSGLDRRCT